MIKRPITKSGKIRYLELFKMVMILAVFFGWLSQFSTVDSSATGLVFGSHVILLLYLIQFGLLTTTAWVDLVVLIGERAVTIPWTTVTLPLSFITTPAWDTFMPVSKQDTYLRNSVIRC